VRITCTHGYFKFEESRLGQISDLMAIFEFELISVEDYFTFPLLAEAKDYSIIGADYLGATAIKTFEGKPWEVMRQNKLIYDFNLDAVMPINSISRSVELSSTSRYFIANGLILPGSVTEDGSRVTDYSAWFFKDELLFRYSEIDYV